MNKEFFEGKKYKNTKKILKIYIKIKIKKKTILTSIIVIKYPLIFFLIMYYRFL